MTALVLFPAPTPAGVIPPDVFLALVLDHGLDRVRRRGAVAAAVRGRDSGAEAAFRGDLLQGAGLRVGGAAGVVERGRGAAVAAEGALHFLRRDFQFGVEDEFAEFLPDRVHPVSYTHLTLPTILR